MANTPLFRSVPRNFLRNYLANLGRRTLVAGETLLAPGQPNNCMYIILSGRLRIHLGLPESEPIELFGQGDCVGEMSTLLDDDQVSAYVIADTNCELLVLDRAVVWSLVKDSQITARNLLNILIHRIRASNRVFVESMEQKNGYAKNAIIDDLTGLYNPRGMGKDFKKQILRCTMDNEPSTLMLLEIDHFQQFNKQYGSLGGDQALRSTAQAILDSMRPRDRAARYSDERFTILMPNTPLAEGCIAAERFRLNISQSNVMTPSGDALPPVTISLGLSESRASDTLEQMIMRAELALLQAKAAGHNCLKF